MGKAPGTEEKSAEKKDKPQDSPPKGKGQSSGSEGCISSGCKTPVTRFGFCKEHYEQFKFGLIKKTGQPVPDYEKKFEHYRAFQAKRGAQKAA